MDLTTGEIVTRRLEHENCEARKFYAGLGEKARVGIEATGCTQWFERLLAELGHELWVGHPGEIRARAVRRQKTDTRDAEHILDLLFSNRFPRIWVPSVEERDVRQMLRHRDKLVQMRTSVKNQLHYLAMSQGVCRKRKLWSEAWPPGIGRIYSWPLGKPAAAGVAGTAGPAGSAHRGAG